MTRHKILSGALSAALLLFAYRPTPAHHSGVMFDETTSRQVTGTVRNFEWANPHVWLWIIVVDGKGASALYAFEGTSPGEMSRRSGWTKNTVTSGDKVTMKFFPFKDAKSGGKILAVTLPDGRTLTAAPGPEPPPPLAPAAPRPTS
jgi:hypothetical protein